MAINRECGYSTARKDSNVRVVAPTGFSLTRRCVEMTGLLRALKNHVSEEDKARIANILNVVRSICLTAPILRKP